LQKEPIKINSMIRKLSVAFDKVIANMYKNNIFPTFSDAVVELYENISKSSNNSLQFRIVIFEENAY